MTTEVCPPAAQESDAALVCRALDGDGDAFASIFHRHKHRVYAVCLRMTNNAAEADDLTQEVFLQVFRKLNTFRGESALSTWLYRLAVNSALMHFRKHSTRHVSFDESGELDAAPSPRREFGGQDDRLACSLERIALTRALQALPQGYRAIFELHEIKGYGHREIAKLLKCSVGNSKSQLHRAKQRIRECLFPRSRRTQRLQTQNRASLWDNETSRQHFVTSKPVSITKSDDTIELNDDKVKPHGIHPPLVGTLNQGLAGTAV